MCVLLSFKNDGTCSIQCNVKPSGESSWGEFVFLTEDGCMLAGWDSRAHSVPRGLVAVPMPVTCHCRGPAPSLPVSSEQQAGNTMQHEAQPPGPVECCYLHIPVVGSFFCSRNCVCFVIIGLFPMFSGIKHLRVCQAERANVGNLPEGLHSPTKQEFLAFVKPAIAF